MSQIRHTSQAPTHTVTHLDGSRIERHRHDDHQLMYVSSGVVAATTAAGTWVAGRASAVWLPAGVWHEHRFHGPSAMHTVGFPADAEVDALPGDSPTVVAVDALVHELVVACTAPDLSDPERARLRAVLADRLRRSEQRALVLPTAYDARLAEACALVEADLAQTLTLGELAERVHVGERTLSRLFRDELGATYPRWRTLVRTYRAMVLLSEGLSVTEVGSACGWATTSAFVDAFGTVTGQTPGAFRHGGSVTPDGPGTPARS